MSKLFFPIIDNGIGLSRTSWAMSLAGACATVLRGHELVFRHISFPYPDGAANIASNEFLGTDCDEMVFIDTDVVFSANHLKWLLEHNEPLVFGMYPKKVPGLHFPVEWLNPKENPFALNLHDENGNPLVEVKRVARGFMRVHRSVLEKMAGYVRMVTNFNGEGIIYNFWENLPGGHSDDFNFCDLWRRLGGRVIVDRRVTTQHEGSAVYPIPGTF